MTALNPPGWLQNAGSTHTAAQLRQYITGLVAGRLTTSSLRARSGIAPAIGDQFVTTQTGSPSMAVLVGTGVACIAGSESATQANYWAANDAQVTLSVTTAHATLPRIDIVVFNVRDSFYSGAFNDCQLQVIAGTAASSPVAPTPPANSITIAQIAVGAAVTSIVNANITDVRNYVAAVGGVIQIRTLSAAPAATEMIAGQLLWTIDTKRLYQYDGTSTNQVYPAVILDPYARKTADETVNNSATLQNDDHLFSSVVASTHYWLSMRLIMNSGTTPDFKMLFTFPAGLTMVLHNVEPTPVVSVPYDQTVVAAMSGTAADIVIQVEGLVIVSSTAGTLQMQWAQNTANASNTILRTNSTMRLIKLN